MAILIDACLALLASIGLWTLGKIVIDKIVWAETIKHLMTIVSVAGDCEHLERALKNRLVVPRCSVLLVDCGLTDIGYDKVRNMLSHYSNISICSIDELPNDMKEAKKWKKQENTIK